MPSYQTGWGGALEVYASADATMTVDHCHFSDVVSIGGGAVYSQGPTVVIQGSGFISTRGQIFFWWVKQSQ